MGSEPGKRMVIQQEKQEEHLGRDMTKGQLPMHVMHEFGYFPRHTEYCERKRQHQHHHY
jgi:hypothetical protein